MLDNLIIMKQSKTFWLGLQKKKL